MSSPGKYIYRIFNKHGYTIGKIIEYNPDDDIFGYDEYEPSFIYEVIETAGSLTKVGQKYMFNGLGENIITDTLEEINKIRVFQ